MSEKLPQNKKPPPLIRILAALILIGFFFWVTGNQNQFSEKQLMKGASIFMLLALGFILWRGEFLAVNYHRPLSSYRVSRKENPIYYWVAIVLALIVTALLAIAWFLDGSSFK